MRVPGTKFARIYRSDAIEWLASQPSRSVHAVVTDPPFGLVEYSALAIKQNGTAAGIWRLPNSRDGAVRSPTPRFTVLSVQDKAKLQGFALAVAAELYRILVPGAHVFWATHPLLSHIVAASFVDVGFEKRGEIIRTITTLRGGERPKGAHNLFREVCVMPKACWEPWVILRKPIYRRIQDNLRRFGTGALRRNSEDEPFRDLIFSSPATRVERAIAPHPSLKPQAFLRQLVRASLPLGEGVILDPFMGSGSTIAAAEALGLTAIGVERAEKYYKMATRAIPRLARLHDQKNGIRLPSHNGHVNGTKKPVRRR